MSFFSSSSSSRSLEEVIDKRLALTDRYRLVPMGTVIQILWHLPLIRDKIVIFKDIFTQGDGLLPEDHKQARYTDAKNAFDGLADIYISNKYSLGDFINTYNINSVDERDIKVEALMAFLPSLKIVYDAANSFLQLFDKRMGLQNSVLDKAKQESNADLVMWYTNLDNAFNEIRTFPVDNIVDRQLLD